MGQFKLSILLLILLFCLIFSSYAYCDDTLYKVIRIKSKGDYYIIHAQRKDSLFKIVSGKVPMNNKSNLEILKKGEYYYFDFRDNESSKKGEVLSGIANNLDVKNKKVLIEGRTRIRFTKRAHYYLYTTKNLIGIYYVSGLPED